MMVFRGISRRVAIRSGVWCASFLTVGLWAGTSTAGVWQPSGVGDCPGHDVATSQGAAPDSAKCDAGFAGRTAVCWANGCTYKNVSTVSCKGGANPGQMYTCVAGSPRQTTGLAWQPVGLGDCPGRDVATTTGPAPDASKCGANFAGQTAVCWTTGCTYKSVATSACTGGATPGQMYTCAAAGARSVAPSAAPSPQPRGGTWQPVGIGDCPGRDVSGSSGTSPDPAKCNPSTAGQTAVCWTTGCTYKSVATSACSGGANPGQMYSCVVAGSPAPGAPSGGRRQEAAAVGGWRAAGVGDCPGRDVGGTAGSSPDPTKCDAGFAGQTAVCWSSGCTYKSIGTAACTGGSNPGQLYTCDPGSAVAPLPPGPGPVKINGKRYQMVNYTAETKNPHDFVIDWNGCKVAELSEDYQHGTEEISVLACKPGSRLAIRTEFKTTGYWVQYDWVVLDKGTTLAGAYRDPAGCGPSAGKRAK